MADPAPQPQQPKGIDELRQKQPEPESEAVPGGGEGDGQPRGNSQGIPSLNPPARKGVDVGGIPASKPTAAPEPQKPAIEKGGQGGGPRDQRAPGSAPETGPGNGPAARPNNAPPVDTAAVGEPLPETATEEDDNDNQRPDPRDFQDDGQEPDEGEAGENGEPGSDESQPDAESSDQPGEGGSAEAGEAEAGGAEAGAGGAEAAAGGAEAGAAAAEGAAVAAEGAAVAAEGAGAATAAVATSEVWVPVAIVVLIVIICIIGLVVITGMASGATNGGGAQSSPDSGAGAACSGKLTGTPKEIIDQQVLPLAHTIDFKDVTPESVTAANAAHGPTSTGGRSDHQGPPDVAWAADISNGTSPTPEMDKLAQKLADCYGFPWHGSGLLTIHKDGYQLQLIYKAADHFDHVHFGLHKE